MVYFYQPNRNKYFEQNGDRYHRYSIKTAHSPLPQPHRAKAGEKEGRVNYAAVHHSRADYAAGRKRGRNISPRQTNREKNLSHEHYLDYNVPKNTCSDRFYPFNGYVERPPNVAKFYPPEVGKFYPYHDNRNVPVVQIEMKRRKFKAICDTGATRSLCTDRFVENLVGKNFRACIRPRKIRTVQADGSSLNILGEVTLNFKLNTDYFRDTFIVYESQDETCLLGFEFFKRHEMAVFNEGLGTPPRTTEDKSLPKVYHLVAMQNMYIPAYSKGIIWTELCDENNRPVIGRERFQILGKEGCVFQHKDWKFSGEIGSYTVAVSNSNVPINFSTPESIEDTYVHKGTCMATLENYQDSTDIVNALLTPCDAKITLPKGKDRKEMLHNFYEQYIENHIEKLKPFTVHTLNKDEGYNSELTNLIRGAVKGSEANILARLITDCSACNKQNLVKCATHTFQYKHSLGIQSDKHLVYNCLLCNYMCGKWSEFHSHVAQHHGIDAGKRSSEPTAEKGEFEVSYNNIAFDSFTVVGDENDVRVFPKGLSIGSIGLAPSLDKTVDENLTEKQERDFETNPSITGDKHKTPCLDIADIGTSTRSSVSDGTVKDIRQILGSDLSSQPPFMEDLPQNSDTRSSVKANNVKAHDIKYDIEHEDIKLDDINYYYTGPGAEEYKKKILDVVAKVPKLWSKSNYDLGNFKYEVKVPLKRKLPHFSDPHRTTHPSKIPAAEALLQELQRNEAMALGMSNYSSPAVWVQKAPGDAAKGAGQKEQSNVRGLRLAVDYRKANLNVRNVSCPAPSAKQMINCLAGKKYATLLDIAHGFWCVRIDEFASQYFSVQALGRVYRFFRLPMGSLSSPAIFLFCLIYTVRGLEAFCLVYADNLTVVSNTLENHEKHIEMVLKRLEHYGWKIKLSKIHFVLHDTPLKFLGFFFNLKDQTIYPDPEKLDAIVKLERPNTVKTVRRLLGSLNFYSSFIPEMQKEVIPISNLLRGKPENNEEIVWTMDAEKAWLKVKMLISNKLVLSLPDYDLNKFHLVTDASPMSVSSALMQHIEKDDKWNPLEYGCKKLNDTQSRYAQAELELMAIVEGLKHNRDVISTAEVFIHTDCRALLYLALFEACSAKLSRWLAYVNSFNHKLLFESSTSPLIKHVDFLTRTQDNVCEKEAYSKQRKTAFENLPKITSEDLGGKTEFTLSELLPILRQFLEKNKSVLNPHEQQIVKREHRSEPNGPLTHPAEWGPPQPGEGEDYCPPLSAKLAETLAEPAPVYNPAHWVQQPFVDHGLPSRPFRCLHTDVEHENLFEPCLRVVSPDDFKLPTEGMINLLQFECPQMDWANIIMTQRKDAKLTQIRKLCEKEQGGIYQRYHLIENVLYKSIELEGQHYLTLVLPKHVIYDVMAQLHRQPICGHQGARRLYEFARRRFFAPNLRRAAQMTVQLCSTCMRFVPATARQRVIKTPIKSDTPGKIWHIDKCVISQKVLPGEKAKPLQFITAVDSKTKYVVAWVAKMDYTQDEFAQDFFARIIAPFGKPDGILTDSEFHTVNMHNFCNALMIKKLRIAPRSSKSNLAERMHRCLLRQIRVQKEVTQMKAIDWPNLLYWSVLTWNHTTNAQGKVPAEDFLGRKQVAPWTCFQNVPFTCDQFSDGAASVLRAQEFISELMNKNSEYREELALKSSLFNQPSTSFPPGTRVYVKAPLLNEHYKKLRERYRDVYVVLEEHDTACIVVPLKQNLKVNLNQTPKDLPRQAIPHLQPRRVDKSELKKCKTLTFFSRPLARDFQKDFFAPYETAEEYFMDPPWDGAFQESNNWDDDCISLGLKHPQMHEKDPARPFSPCAASENHTLLPVKPKLPQKQHQSAAKGKTTKKGPHRQKTKKNSMN